MIDDMRKFTPETHAGYVRVVRQFSAFLGRPPETATTEELPNYQLHLIDHRTSSISLNAAGWLFPGLDAIAEAATKKITGRFGSLYAFCVR